jgi:hypothetical protein
MNNTQRSRRRASGQYHSGQLEYNMNDRRDVCAVQGPWRLFAPFELNSLRTPGLRLALRVRCAHRRVRGIQPGDDASQRLPLPTELLRLHILTLFQVVSNPRLPPDFSRRIRISARLLRRSRRRPGCVRGRLLCRLRCPGTICIVHTIGSSRRAVSV